MILSTPPLPAMVPTTIAGIFLFWNLSSEYAMEANAGERSESAVRTRNRLLFFGPLLRGDASSSFFVPP